MTGPALSQQDEMIAAAMLQRGDEPWHVAYWFGVPESEIELIQGTQPTPGADASLPPPGPYPPIREVDAALSALAGALDTLNIARRAAGMTPHSLRLPIYVCRKGEAVIEPPEEPPETGGEVAHSPRRIPTKYAVPSSRPQRLPRPAPVPTTRTESDRALHVHVRLMFERGGFCKITLLPRRTADLPPQLDAELNGDVIGLSELQDDWFDDIHPQNIGPLLREGFAFHSPLPERAAIHWVLSGREVYVLAPHPDLAGLLSCPRLAIGEQHAVLCTVTILNDVLEAIRETGSPDPELLDESAGAPAGWVVLKNVLPSCPVEHQTGTIIDVLRPRADIEIVFSGGVRIDRTVWLAGRPPMIRVLGNSVAAVLIDGREAIKAEDGSFSAPAWDSIGSHQVSCGGSTRSYSIQEFQPDWASWPAHSGSLGEQAGNAKRCPSICGPLVYSADADFGNNALRTMIWVENPVLIGANPGDIYTCQPYSQIHVSDSGFIAAPSFEPTWQIPAATHRRKQPFPVRAIEPAAPLPLSRIAAVRPRAGRSITAWYRAILEACRRKLAVLPADAATIASWTRYRNAARTLRKRFR